MKRIFFLTFLFLGLMIFANAQTIKINEPEFTGSIVYVNDTIGSGIPLEKQVYSIKAKAIYFVGIGKATSFGVIKGKKSPVRIQKKENLQFIIKLTDNSIDPATIINIFKLTEKKDTRIVELASLTTFEGTKSNDIPYLPFVGKKYGNSSYLIEISSIETGEYAITLPTRQDLFYMFGVD